MSTTTKLSSKDIKCIENMMKLFLWGDCPNKNRIQWVGWMTLARPLYKCGLGMTYLNHFNEALLAKQIWRVIENPHLLFSQVMLAKHGKGDIEDITKQVITIPGDGEMCIWWEK